MPKMIATCGLDCSVCEAYLAYQAKDPAKLQEVAIKWSQNYQSSINPEDIKCDGCSGEGVLFSWCLQCPIRACAKSKGYATCAECGDFPCSTNEFLYSVTPAAKANLELLRKG